MQSGSCREHKGSERGRSSVTSLPRHLLFLLVPLLGSRFLVYLFCFRGYLCIRKSRNWMAPTASLRPQRRHLKRPPAGTRLCCARPWGSGPPAKARVIWAPRAGGQGSLKNTNDFRFLSLDVLGVSHKHKISLSS